MQHPSYENLIAPKEPLTDLEVPTMKMHYNGKQLLYLVYHGCRVVESENTLHIFFPEGTTQQELYPRTSGCRYRIILPDHTFLLYWHDESKLPEYRKLIFIPEVPYRSGDLA